MLKWWRLMREHRRSRIRSGDENLPFTPDELARLIRNGSRDDFKRLAAGFSDPRRARRPF